MSEQWGKLTDDWVNISEIIVYCFGLVTEVVFDKISKDIDVRFIIDNSPKMHGKEYNGIPIYSYEECKKWIGKTKIVIATETISSIEVAESLQADGYCENKDYTMLERFVTEWYDKRFHQANLLEIHTAITTKCTFNCRYCNMFMPYYKGRIDYSLKEIQANIELLFRHVDYVFKYQLLGGEPFLNGDLHKIILHLYEHYHSQIGMIRIVTNGSVIPSDELVDAMRRCNCYILLSNYTHSIPYLERYNEVKKILLGNGIKFRELIDQRWRDTGFPHQPRNLASDKVREHMLTCATFWHGLADEKLFYCNCAWSAANTGLYDLQETDYLDLKILDEDEESRIEILKFVLGDRQPGYYNGFCRVCGGCGKDNNRFVASGEQMK